MPENEPEVYEVWNLQKKQETSPAGEVSTRYWFLNPQRQWEEIHQTEGGPKLTDAVAKQAVAWRQAQTATQTGQGVGSLDILKAATGIALPVAGQVGGGLLGLATGPFAPVAAPVGEMLGGAGGEYAAQKLGLSEPSNLQVALAGGVPGLSRVAQAIRRTPIGKFRAAGAARESLEKYLPAESASALYKAAIGEGKLVANEGIGRIHASIAEHANEATNKWLNTIIPEIDSGKGLAFEEADKLVRSLANKAIHSTDPNEGWRLFQIRNAIRDELGPSYKSAAAVHHRTESLSRIQEEIQKASDPGKAFRDLRAEGQIVGEGHKVIREGQNVTMKAFSTKELNEMQSLFDRLPTSLKWQTLMTTRVIGGAAGAYLAGGTHGGALEYTSGAAAGIMAMMSIPYGRRLLSTMIDTGAINNPRVVAAGAAIARAIAARMPITEEPPPFDAQ